MPRATRQRHRPARDQCKLVFTAKASITPTTGRCRYARGKVLDLRVESETYPIKPDGLRADFARATEIPYLDVVATFDESQGQVCLLMLNRDLESERELLLDWHDLTPSRVLTCQTLTGPDLKAVNTFAHPTAVAPRPLEAPQPAASMTFRLPPRSYTVAVVGM